MKVSSPFPGPSGFRQRRAFTLIEMLVVIGIIALLAGMLIPLSGLVARKKILARARIQIDALDMAISVYKTKKASYPPDNPTAPAGAFTNQLYYELWGMIYNPNAALYTNTLHAKETIKASLLTQFFGAAGVVNSSTDPNDVINFIPRLNAADIQNLNTTTDPVWVFASISPGPANGLPVANGTLVNVIRYVSSNPTNNPNTFDLWVDVLIGGKTNRVSNWSKEPEIVAH